MKYRSDNEVYKLLDEKSEVVSNIQDQNNGNLTLEFKEEVPEIEIGSVIIGNEGNGFLKKVNDISYDGKKVSLKVSDANLEQAFATATFNFDENLNGIDDTRYQDQDGEKIELAEGIKQSEEPFTYLAEKTVIFKDEIAEFILDSGKIDFNPRFYLYSKYQTGQLDSIDFGIKDTELAFSGNLIMKLKGKFPIKNIEKELVHKQKKFSIPVGGIRIPVIMDFKLIAQLELSSEDELNFQTQIENKYVINSHIERSGSGWRSDLDIDSSFESNPVDASGNINFKQDLKIVPKVTFRILDVVGPFAEPKVLEKFNLEFTTVDRNWESTLDVGFQLDLGINMKIFEYENELYRKEFEPKMLNIYRAPDTLMVISEENLSGYYSMPLPEPVFFQVTDNFGNPIPQIPVYFEIIDGDGYTSRIKSVTGNHGYTSANWVLGSEGEQKLKAYIINTSNEIVSEQIVIAEGEVNPNPIDANTLEVDFSSSQIPDDKNFDFSQIHSIELRTDATSGIEEIWLIGMGYDAIRVRLPEHDIKEGYYNLEESEEYQFPFAVGVLWDYMVMNENESGWVNVRTLKRNTRDVDIKFENVRLECFCEVDEPAWITFSGVIKGKFIDKTED